MFWFISEKCEFDLKYLTTLPNVASFWSSTMLPLVSNAILALGSSTFKKSSLFNEERDFAKWSGDVRTEEDGIFRTISSVRIFAGIFAHEL